MYVIVKHVVVIEHDEFTSGVVYADGTVSRSTAVNMLAVLPEHGCHYSLIDATRVADDLNEKHGINEYDCVYILNHS